MKIIKKFHLILILFLLFFLFLFFSKPVSAQTLFLDEFNGTGELHSYNNSYELLTDFHNNTGLFSLNTNHVEGANKDPGYVYTAIPANNICASIDFNWTGGYSDGHWTDIILYSTANSFKVSFQVRDDFGTQQRWVYYDKAGSVYIDGPVSFDENQTHTLKACVNGQTVTGYLDNILLFTHQENIYSGGYMGFASQEHSYYLDNFQIENIITDPIPLEVPILKQTDSPWNSQLYDTANAWNPSDPSIKAWGCALTSAAMVLKYHKLDKLPDGTALDPGSLNTWLKNQQDGYIGNGLLNWLAISRLSKLAKAKNNITAFDALEYNRVVGANKTQLTADITANIPDILEEPGHYIVAKGIQQNSFSINDPFFDRTNLASYSDTFLSLNRFVPSHTNLSYIMIVLDTNISGTLKTSSGNAVGNTFIQNPITNPLNSSQTSSPAKRIIYLQKPGDDSYTLELSSTNPTQYNAQIYLYDQDGNVIVIPETGIVGNNTDKITIKFKKSGNKTDKVERTVTFQSIIDDIKDLRASNDIKKEKLKTDLVTLMEKAEKITKEKKIKKNELEQKFDDFKEDIKKNRKKDMTEEAYQILLYDMQFLKDIYL